MEKTGVEADAAGGVVHNRSKYRRRYLYVISTGNVITGPSLDDRLVDINMYFYCHPY